MRLKKGKGKTISSQKWLQRQLQDPYVKKAAEKKYRARSAFKLTEIHEKTGVLRLAKTIVDLGAAPGSWGQVARELAPKSFYLGVDLQPVAPLGKNAFFVQGDFLEEATQGRILECIAQHYARDKTIGTPPERNVNLTQTDPKLGQNYLKTVCDGAEEGRKGENILTAQKSSIIDVVLSDMAPPASGHPPTDHWRSAALVEAVLQFSKNFLAPGGHVAAKVLQGSEEKILMQAFKTNFEKTVRLKPLSSRTDSREFFLIGLRKRSIAGQD